MRLQGTWLTPAPVASQKSTENNRAVKLFKLELYERVPFGLVAEWQTGKKKINQVGLTPKHLTFWCNKHKISPEFHFESIQLALIDLEWKFAFRLHF